MANAEFHEKKQTTYIYHCQCCGLWHAEIKAENLLDLLESLTDVSIALSEHVSEMGVTEDETPFH